MADYPKHLCEKCSVPINPCDACRDGYNAAQAEKSVLNSTIHKLFLDLQGYFNAERGADRYYRDYDLKKRVNAVVEQLPQ